MNSPTDPTRSQQSARQDRLELAADEVHVWFVAPQQITDPEVLARLRRIASPEEHRRCARFAFDRLQHQYLVTRGLVRSVLSFYAGTSPEQWQFTENSYGKPAIATPEPDIRLQFNLSHTRGLIVCAVGRDYDVGVDVESLGRKVNVKIADRFFAPAEVEQLHRLSREQQRLAFLNFWTLKESYIKACGKGLAIPLSKFWFSNSRPERICIDFAEDYPDDPDRWCFESVDLPSQHRIAVASCNRQSERIRLTLRDASGLL